MVKVAYVPDRGDIVWLDFNPTKGHEQRGVRPALVISRQKYNSKSGLLLACPISSNKKGYPFEVVVRSGDIEGVILVDQIKSIDWKVRRVRYKAKADNVVLSEVQGKFAALIN